MESYQIKSISHRLESTTKSMTTMHSLDQRKRHLINLLLRNPNEDSGKNIFSKYMEHFKIFRPENDSETIRWNSKEFHNRVLNANQGQNCARTRKILFFSNIFNYFRLFSCMKERSSCSVCHTMTYSRCYVTHAKCHAYRCHAKTIFFNLGLNKNALAIY